MGNVEFPITFVNRNPLNSAHVITLGRPLMQILVSIGAVGASPQIGEILPFVTFHCPVLSCPYCFTRSCADQVESLDRYSHFMAQNDVFPGKMVPFAA